MYAQELLSDARRMRMDPTLLMAVVTVESHWNPNSRSWAGAEGLGQLLPSTAHTLGVDPWSGRSNLKGMTMYLHRLLSLFHDAREPIRLALAGYNAGPLAVQRYGGVPPIGETRNYVVKVMATWHHFKTRLPSNFNEIAERIGAAEVVARAQNAYWGVSAP